MEMEKNKQPDNVYRDLAYYDIHRGITAIAKEDGYKVAIDVLLEYIKLFNYYGDKSIDEAINITNKTLNHDSED